MAPEVFYDSLRINNLAIPKDSRNYQHICYYGGLAHRTKLFSTLYYQHRKWEDKVKSFDHHSGEYLQIEAARIYYEVTGNQNSQ